VRAVCVALLSAVSLTACFGLRAHGHPERPVTVHTLSLVGQSSVPPLMRVPEIMGLPFGGVSGLTTRYAGTELLGISDAQQGGRVYRFTIEGVGGDLRVTPTTFIPLQMVPGNYRPDHESLALLANGDLLVSSEGSSREPRLPPAIAEYGPHGEFIRLLPLRDRYVPETSGPMTHGARGNAGFESLTLSPDGRRLFTATETALVQDGEPASFAAGTRARILEYVARHGTYEPAREFAYDVERLDTPPFAPGVFVNGLVDLLALSRTTLLALERSYVEDAANTARNINCIRVFRIALAGATDISRIESLKDHPDVVPVTKTLLIDLAKVQGLNQQLVGTLDNFEGMTFGPLLPDGRPTLLLVSDDNFNKAQRTWFLLFAIE
jgi:hypothetical protein